MPEVATSHARRCSYTNWTSTARQCDDFFSDRNAINLYKNHVKTVLTRVNTVTGQTYGSDPTIFGARPLPSHDWRREQRHAELPYLRAGLWPPDENLGMQH